ncbi:MAG: replication protein [Bacteroidales bacterium]|nr:replication protein [Bacteroidales bacterium]
MGLFPKIIRDEYKSLVFASKKAIKDEIMLNTNINKICSWFQQTNRRPWLRIAGYIGNGKSTMLKAVKNWFDKTHQRQMMTFYTANDLVKLAVSDPETFNNVIHRHKWLIIDDLGTEPNEVVVYGNKMQPVREMFYARYDKKLVTIFTTNLSDAAFSDYYGERIADRCNEMQQKIIFSQTSYRS